MARPRSQEPPVLAPGDMLDRYELLCAVAEGGMGTVWLARLAGKHGFERLVAVKTILPSFAWDPKFQKMFLDEARIAAGILHPNVAQILDLGEEGGILYFVMEWVDGASLRALVRAVADRHDPFPSGIALRIAADVCAGLHAAHEVNRGGAPLGVVHRDISPQNILITTAGVTKIIDFGIAKARGRASSETETGEVKGKAKYMAPEQALGCKVDRRADLWAVGAILYEVIAGRPLSKARTPYEAVTEMMHGHDRKPLAEHVPPAVAAVIDRALVPDLGGRFDTAADMQRALELAGASCGLLASTADVAAFTREYLSELIEQRERLVEDALARIERRRTEPPSGFRATGAGTRAHIVPIPAPPALPQIAPPARRPSFDTIPQLVPATRRTWGVALTLGGVFALGLGALALLTRDPGDPTMRVKANAAQAEGRAMPPPDENVAPPVPTGSITAAPSASAAPRAAPRTVSPRGGARPAAPSPDVIRTNPF